MAMTADQIAVLQAELDEVNSQLSQMVGSASFSEGGFSVDEKGLQEQLEKRKASLEFRLASPQGEVTDTCVALPRQRGGY